MYFIFFELILVWKKYNPFRYLRFYRLSAPIIPCNFEEDNSIIILDDVCKTYVSEKGGKIALQNVSFKIKKGEFVIIMGHSGSGKSTLLNIIGTIDPPTQGNVIIDSIPINHKTKEYVMANIRRDTIGFVFQSFNLIPKLSAIENVELPMLLQNKLSHNERKERAKQLLDEMKLSHRYEHTLVEMSGGEQQRVTIARSLANNPKILLLDEPTGDLDEYSTYLVMQKLLELNNNGLTIVMVTHNETLQNLANRLIFMKGGKIDHERIVSKEEREIYIKHIDGYMEQHDGFFPDNPDDLQTTSSC